MADFVTAIIETPYIIAPVMAWLWAQANFPSIKWGKVASGALMAFGGKILSTLILALGPFLSNEWMTWPGSLINLVGTVSSILGLAIMGFYVLYGALVTWKLRG
jgi:hypothetical protein